MTDEQPVLRVNQHLRSVRESFRPGALSEAENGDIFDDRAENLLYGNATGDVSNVSPFDQPEQDHTTNPPGLHEKAIANSDTKNSTTNWKKWLLIGIIALIVILAAVLIPVGILVISKHDDSSNKPSSSSSSSDGSSGSGSEGSNSGSSNGVPSSAKGSILDPSTWLDTVDFNTTYTNDTVGGLSIMGLNSTWNDSARSNNNVPSLNISWNYTTLPMRGVNLGGWLVLEPFITPSFFNYSSDLNIVDEWSLSTYLRNSSSSSQNSTLQKTLETHYANFVTEETFSEIAEAGLDHVRIPYPYWLVKTYSGDPYLSQVGWRYLLRGIEWARKYGLRVVLDLHSVPGSQNGWNHSGKEGYPNWLNGTEGYVYGNETVNLHGQLAAFFAQDRYKNVISMYGLVNEPKMLTLDHQVVIDWTKAAYQVVRLAGYDNYIVFSDGFLGPDAWPNIFNETDYPKMVIDLHEYTVFNKDNIAMPHTAKTSFVCNNWAALIDTSTSTITGHGPTIVGEFSQADNDCAEYVNAVGDGPRWEGKFQSKYNVTEAILQPVCATPSNCTCSPSNMDPQYYDNSYKQFLSDYGQAQMQVFEQNGSWGFLYWTWDVEDDNSSQWSYKKARDAGMLPDKAYSRTFNCSTTVPDFGALGLSESY